MKKIFILIELIVMFFTFVFGKIADIPNLFNPDDETTTSVSQEELTSENQTENSDDYIEHEPPYMFYFTLENFVEFKNAYETMTEEEFGEFIYETKKYYGNANIHSREDAKRIIEMAESTTVILLDGKTENFQEMDFYVENNYMFQPVIIVDGQRHIGCSYYPPLNEKSETFLYDNVEGAEFIKEVTNGEVTAKVYFYNDEFRAEMRVNGTLIRYRVWTSTGVDSIEEFEADFARFEFAKIGDLLNEINVSDSQEETSELSSTVTTETIA